MTKDELIFEIGAATILMRDAYAAMEKLKTEGRSLIDAKCVEAYNSATAYRIQLWELWDQAQETKPEPPDPPPPVPAEPQPPR